MIAADALARVADRSTLRLTVRGRKTAAPYGVTVWFAVDGSIIYLATLDATRSWVRNAKKTPAVELAIDGLRLRGRFAPITDPALAHHVHALLARKYWAAWLGSWVGLEPDETFRVDELTPADPRSLGSRC